MTNSSKRRALLVLGGALALAACGGTSSESNAANATAESSAANASAVNESAVNSVAPSASSEAAVTADFMVGKWSATGEDCSGTIEFRKDGTLVTPIGGGKWTLTGDKLAVDFGDGSTQSPTTISVISPDRIEITTDSGRKETQKRC